MTDTCFSSSFSDIDAASNPTEFVYYMDDANAMKFFRAAKIRTHEPISACATASVWARVDGDD